MPPSYITTTTVMNNHNSIRGAHPPPPPQQFTRRVNRTIKKRKTKAARRQLTRDGLNQRSGGRLMSTCKRSNRSDDRFENRLRELSGPAFGNPCLVHDPIDLISLQRIWEEDPQGRRIPSEEVKYLFSYLEDGRFIRGFDCGSLQQLLRQPRPLLHPTSRKVIPEDVLQRADKFVNFLVSKQLMTPSKKKDLAWIPVKRLTRNDIRNLSFEVFQHMGRQSVVVDEETLLRMSREELVTVVRGLQSMFINNFTADQRRQFQAANRQPFAHPPRLGGSGRVKAANLPLALAQYILRELRQLLRRAPENLKYMISYVAVGGLSMVDEDLRRRYRGSISHDSDGS